jgi:hypothetical protein
MAEMLIRSPSARKMCTTTELSQSIAAGVIKSTVLGSGRGSRGESSRRRRSRRWYGASRKANGVKGSRAVTAKKRTPRGKILHSKARRVELNRTRIVSCKLTNGKKVIDHLRSNKNIMKTKGTRSRTHGCDRKTRPITNHDRRRMRRVRGSN